MKRIALAFLLFTAIGVGAQQKQNCGDTDAVFKLLQGTYGERVIFVGRVLDVPDFVVTIWATPNGKTATIVRSSLKDKQSCAVEFLEETKHVNNSQNTTRIGVTNEHDNQR